MSQLTFAQVVKNKPTPPPLSPPLSPLSLNNPELYKDNNANTWFYRQVDRKNVKLPPVKTTIKPLANVFSRSLIIIFSETFEMFRFIIFDEIESYQEYQKTSNLKDIAHIMHIEMKNKMENNDENKNSSISNLEIPSTYNKSTSHASIEKICAGDIWEIYTGKYKNPFINQLALMYLVTELQPLKKLVFSLNGCEIDRYTFNDKLNVCDE